MMDAKKGPHMLEFGVWRNYSGLIQEMEIPEGKFQEDEPVLLIRQQVGHLDRWTGSYTLTQVRGVHEVVNALEARGRTPSPGAGEN